MSIASFRCEYCGRFNEVELDYAYTEIERTIIETLRDIRASLLSPVTTQQIADATGYHPRHIRRQLTEMKRHGIVCLPRGRCSGWTEAGAYKAHEHIVMEHDIQLAAA
jgi:DNA-binding transcriptional ArsR family regulator